MPKVPEILKKSMSVLVISYCSVNFTIFLAADECKTTGGNRFNRTCAFPFWYRGTTYESCTTVDDDTPWCSTQVDSDGVHDYGEWGYCDEGCPGTTQGMFIRE